MKTLKYILTVFTLVLFSTSCDEQLDILPMDDITSETLYQSEDGVHAGLMGIYSRIVQLYRQTTINGLYPSSGTDEGLYSRNENRFFIKNNFTPAETSLRDTWINFYRAINSANTFIKNVKSSSWDGDNKDAFIAEGYFIRGYLYFELIKAFGGPEGIPMPLENHDNSLLPRTPGLEVYNQVIADLKYAAENLPHEADVTPGRAGKNAAKGLLARAYLHIAGEPYNQSGAYEEAKKYSKEIIDDTYFALNPSYQDVFDKLAMEEYDSKEVLFQIAFFYGDQNQSSKIGSVLGMKIDTEACKRGYAQIFNTISLVLAYRNDPTDERGLWNASPYYVSNKLYDGSNNTNCDFRTTTSQYKYPSSKYRRLLESDGNGSYGPHHWPVLRFSDVLLMYAEAENQINPGSSEALDKVNMVRARAKATAFTTIDTEKIQEERRLELCFEGLRRYDLVRWGILTQKVNETKTYMETKFADAEFWNLDWEIYGEPNLGADGIPQSGDEPIDLNRRKNYSNDLNYFLDSYNDYDENKHKWLPIPQQEIGANNLIKQNTGW